MKIEDIQGTGVRQLHTEQTVMAESRGKKAGAAQDPAADSISVSQEAKLMQKASQIIAQTEDVRQDKVEPLMQAVAQGVYGVDAQKVANSMIANMIMER
jgi:flagellar biosynthesis anti-sigma factor FlgM